MMRLSLSALTLTLSFALAPVLASSTVATRTAGEDVRVTGCLIKAAGEDDALLVTTLARMEAPPYTVDGRAADRRAPAYMRVVFWLDDDEDDLDGHQGRLVEIRGVVGGDVDRGEIKVEREDDRVDVEFKADGDRRLKARLPLLSRGFVERPAATATTNVSTT